MTRYLFYGVLGVNWYRKFIIQVKKKYDRRRGKPDTDNYFLKDYSEEGVAFLKILYYDTAL